MTCANVKCRSRFTAPNPRQLYCSPECRVRAKGAKSKAVQKAKRGAPDGSEWRAWNHDTKSGRGPNPRKAVPPNDAKRIHISRKTHKGMDLTPCDVSWWMLPQFQDRAALQAEAVRRHPSGTTRESVGPLLRPLVA
jgi:hypothetical protein